MRDADCPTTEVDVMIVGSLDHRPRARSGFDHAIDAMPDEKERIIERRMNQHATNVAANLAGVEQLIEDGDA